MKVPYQGKQVDAEEVEFLIVREDWNEYQLLDGVAVRIKLVVTEVAKVLGEEDPEGNPVYSIKSTNVVRVKK